MRETVHAVTDDGEIGWIRRTALLAVGLVLATGLSSALPLYRVVGVLGLVVFTAAAGIPEYAMVKYYRWRITRVMSSSR
ncbi:MAG: hypothetical protein JWM34_3376 [Ilumatobacteraceae bacterium]|nr:hypothetical protein [Ilumatobacteraceae bacterium]